MTTSKHDKQAKHANYPSAAFLWQHPSHLLALGLGSGLIRWAPGSFGSLLGVAAYAGLLGLSLTLKLSIISALFLLGIAICQRAGQALGVSDHSSIVWDEIVAMMLVLTFTPNTVMAWLLAFIVFRCMDIFKPFPIRQIDQQVKGGLGVMLDDLLAALFSIALLQGLLMIKPEWMQ
jgi:phosphatidylglycerophosphatase A